jgi:diacylglycerol kinase family enzyme
MTREALMVTVANGSQFGNNAYIAPTALLDDGKMDICILRKFPHAAIPAMAYQLFSKGIEQSRYSECLRTNDLWVRQEGEMAHLDGEPVMLGKEIHFKVLPRALNIFAPKVFLDDIRTKYPINRPG